jgi:hypothetical protein
VGNELADRRGVGDGLGVADGDSVPDTVTVGDTEGLALALALVVAPLLAVLLVAVLAVAEPVTEGEKMAGAVVDEDAEQAERATEPSTVKAPRPAAVSLALSTVPAMVVRTFMEPPHRPGRWRPCFRSRRQKHFRIPAAETGRRRKPRSGPITACAARGRLRNTALDNGKAYGRRRQAMACSASEY